MKWMKEKKNAIIFAIMTIVIFATYQNCVLIKPSEDGDGKINSNTPKGIPLHQLTIEGEVK